MTGLEVDVDLPGRGVRLELSVGPGETCALIGPNGAGKSSVLESVIGVLTPASGQIRLDGRVLTGPGMKVPVHRRRVGWLAQRPLLFEHLTVRDNVAFGLVANGQRRAEARLRALDELELVGARELADRRPSQLSGGQAQRVGIARALAAEPDALLLDEPLAAIDVQGAAEIRQVLAQRLHALALPVLLVTHDLIDLWRLADRVVVLADGRIVEQGSVAQVMRRPRNEFPASLGGRNLISGVAAGSESMRADGLVVHGIPDAPLGTGVQTLALIEPAAIAVHRNHPEGSPRNVWSAQVSAVEPRGDAARLVCAASGQILTVDLTAAAVAELGLAPGVPVWLSVKASQVLLYPR